MNIQTLSGPATWIKPTRAALLLFLLFHPISNYAAAGDAISTANRITPNPELEQLPTPTDGKSAIENQGNIPDSGAENSSEIAEEALTTSHIPVEEPAAALLPLFRINTFNIEGNKLITAERIQTALEPFTGPDKSGSDLFAARAALFELYRNEGLTGVAVSNPEIAENGGVLMRIFEGDIDAEPEATESRGAEVATAMPTQQTADHTSVADDEKAEPELSEAQAPAASQTAYPAGWVGDGWKLFDEGDFEQALATWKQGVDTMPGYRYLAFLGVYKQQGAAIRQLKRAGAVHHAIILRSTHENEAAYYVMSALDTPYDKQERQHALTSLREATGIAFLYANAARKFQADETAVSATEQSKAKSAPAKPSTAPDIKASGGQNAAEVSQSANSNSKPATAFEVHGNTLVTARQIRRVMEQRLGTSRTETSINQAKADIYGLYHKQGYFMVAIAITERDDGSAIARIYEIPAIREPNR